MKAGILTLYEADSYGAVLQAYALQYILARLGADSEFVNIRMPGKSVEPVQVPRAAALFARRLQAEEQKRAALFAEFRKKYLRFSRPYDPRENIDGDYDLFIAGSDQIWNFQIPGVDARYFLPFASPGKRCSYAASFGTDALPEKVRDWTAAQLKQFHAISLREERGREIVKELTGMDALVHLDPTLLPKRSQWKSLTEEHTEKGYILLFLLKYDEALVNAARQEAEKQGVELCTITACFLPQTGVRAWNTAGVTDWLSAIRNAGCVFTNSFHGAVFSMVFERDFHIRGLTGELSSRNGRLEELLSFLGLSQALEGVVRPDYESVWVRLEGRRQESLDYLRRLVAYDTDI